MFRDSYSNDSEDSVTYLCANLSEYRLSDLVRQALSYTVRVRLPFIVSLYVSDLLICNKYRYEYSKYEYDQYDLLVLVRLWSMAGEGN